MTHPWVMGKNCLKYHSNTSYQWKIMSKTQILAMCALWPWPLSHSLWSKSRHTLRSLTTIVWNIIQIQQGSKTLWPGHRVWLCVHGDLDLGYMTFGQGHYTPLGHGQHLCEILSKCNEVVRSYGRTRILAMSWPWVKVMTYNWVTDNTCVKYYWNQTWQ